MKKVIDKLVLGSSSPRRLELLKQINVTPFLVLPANINEDELKHEDASDYVKRVALAKNLAIISALPEHLRTCIIITADTVVVKSRKILQKPIDADDAHKMLSMLSGTRHKVLTSFVISRVLDGIKEALSQKLIKTTVTVQRLSETEIKWYLNTNQWQDKSGSYGIQGAFEGFVKQINGSYSNIIGLPLLPVKNSLLGMGYEFNYKI